MRGWKLWVGIVGYSCVAGLVGFLVGNGASVWWLALVLLPIPIVVLLLLVRISLHGSYVTVVRAPPEVVFEVLGDLVGEQAWEPRIESTELLTAASRGLGTRVRHRMRGPSGTVVAESEIVAFAAPTSVSRRTTGGRVVQTNHMTVAHRDRTTTVDTVYELRVPLFSALTFPMWRTNYEQEWRTWQDRLAARVEARSHSPRQQD